MKYKTRTLQLHERNRLTLALRGPMFAALQPPPEQWAWMTGAEAVEAGLLDPRHVRSWPSRRRWPEGVCWADVSHPSDLQRKWAWGFAPWYLEQMAGGQ